MHVKAKQMAFLGLLAAIVSIFILLASFIESNTLFLLAAAAFMVGIAIREYGLRIGTGFFVACILIGLLLSPNKLYVLTYAGLSLYILWNETAFWFLSKIRFQKHKQVLFFFTKLVFFNLFYIPIILLFPKLLFSFDITNNIFLLLIVGGQIGWLIYDKAYEYFQIFVWGKLRGKIELLQ